MGLALFESKPTWIFLDSAGFIIDYTPGYRGHLNRVRWTGSEYEASPDCPGNLNGDNVVDITDLFVVLNNWGAVEGIADINGDHVVDITDLFVVLNNWGTCP